MSAKDPNATQIVKESIQAGILHFNKNSTGTNTTTTPAAPPHPPLRSKLEGILRLSLSQRWFEKNTAPQSTVAGTATATSKSRVIERNLNSAYHCTTWLKSQIWSQ